MQKVFASSTSVTVEVNNMNSDWSKCKVKLPKSSEYGDYYISLPQRFCEDLHGYYAL